MRSVLLIALVASPALANDDGLTGFVTYGAGDLRGRVTDDGKPVANATVHVVCKDKPEQALRTDARGRYHATLDCGHDSAFVFVRGNVRVEGLVTMEADNVIESHEAIPPKSMPKAKTETDKVLAYTDAAMDADKWTRAWLLLDVDAQGKVEHVKLLNAPGFDLDAIAVKAGFDVEFEPARDTAGNAVRAAVLWTWEWPAYWFMRKVGGSMYHLPEAVSYVDCDGKRPREDYHRDCTPPDLAHLADRPWLDRP
jgi:hypothetical protein